MPLQNFNGQWSYSSKAEMKSLEGGAANARGRGGPRRQSHGLAPAEAGRQHGSRAGELLRDCGKWLKQYGASIYDTRGGPYYPTPFGVCTYRGDTIFVHVLNWPGDRLVLPPIHRKLVSSRLLTGGTAEARQRPDGSIEIAVPRERRQEIDTIVALKLDGPAKDAKPGRLASGSLAAGKPVRASNVFGDNPWFAPENAVDDDAYTRWATDFATKEAWLEVDLGEDETFNGVAIKEDMDLIRHFEVQVKQAGRWVPVVKGDNDRRELPQSLRSGQSEVRPAGDSGRGGGSAASGDALRLQFPHGRVPRPFDLGVPGACGSAAEQPHAVAVDAEPRREAVAIRRTAVGGGIAPRAAAEHARRYRRRPRRIDAGRLLVVIAVVPIAAPLPDVAVHVVQSPGVRFLLADRMRSAARVALEPAVLGKLGLAVAEAVSRG